MNVRIGLGMRLTLVMALSLAAVGAIAVVGWWAYQRAFDSIVRSNLDTLEDIGEKSLTRQGQASARLLADQLANPVYFLDLSAIGRITRAVVEQGDVAYVIVFDADGNVLHDGSDDIGTFGQAMNDEFTARASATTRALVQTSERLIDITQPLLLGNERIGGVRVGMSRAPARAALAEVGRALFARAREVDNSTRLRLIWPLLAVLGVAGLVAFLALRKVVQPLRELADHAREIEQGRFSIVLDRRRLDEIGDLQQAFARMSRSLGDYDRQIRALAYRDALTGLGNRLALRESLPVVLERTRAKSSRAALLFIDLDDFKRINDTLGHESGDRVLVQVAERIVRARDETRVEDVTASQAEDEMAARFGGDEFVVVLLGNDVRERARRMAQLTLDLLRLPLVTEVRPVVLNVSIGIALFPDDAEEAPGLLRNADVAMYQAKMHGKNGHRFFNRHMLQLAEERLGLEQDLRHALLNNGLEMHYQPIVDLATSQVIGAEGLMRWNHPERGTISPAVFVAVAEEFGLIEQLGEFALRRACRDNRTWPARADGQPLWVSVNFSVRQLKQRSLPGRIADALDEHGLAAERVHIELTESALLGNDAESQSTLAALARIGVPLWLDDFGTGFSGLAHLRTLTVEGVKIDRSFIQELLNSRSDRALAGAIIALTRSLGIRCIAEGVESPEQMQALVDLNCDMVQGFWLGYPMSAADFLVYLGAGPGSAARVALRAAGTADAIAANR